MTSSLRAVAAGCILLLSSVAGPLSPPALAHAAPASVPALAAATFTVNSANDAVADFTNDPSFSVCHTGPANSICTLRAAVMNANRHLGGATIHVPAGTYVIQLPPTGGNDDSNGDLDLINKITLDGAGPDSTIVDGGGLDGVFDIYAGGVVTMTGVTIRHGHNGKFDVGGGIDVDSQLFLSNSALTDNFAHDGGAGLFVGGRATLDRVTVARNAPVAILVMGSLTITNSSLYDNDGQGYFGGAIQNFGGHLTVFNSTLSNNRTSENGGAIANEASSTATILASTIAGNLAGDQADFAAAGGGIYNQGTLLLGDTLLADNFVSHTLNACAGNPITSQDYNDLDVAAGCTLAGTTTHNVVSGTSLLLGPLAGNGGPTLTRALFPGNPAVDQIPPAFCRDPLGAAPVPDQRGVARPIGPQCDIGALEGAPLLSPYFRNLVANGDAEASAGSPNGAWVGAADWFNKSGQFTVVNYNAFGGFPSVPTDTVPANHGDSFFAGGKVTDTIGAQVVPLPPELAASTNAGNVNYLFTADLGGFGNQDDNAQVLMRFQSATFVNLGSVTLGPVLAADRGNLTTFLHRAATGVVPANTVWIVFDVIITRVFTHGSYNDGYADNVVLMLLPKHALFAPALFR